VQRAQGDLPSASSSYKQHLEIAQKLAVRDLANTDWQRDLGISYERIGDVQRAQGDLPSALSSYKQCLEIAQKLAARDPATAQWKTDLVISLWKLASILEQQDSPQKREAGVNYQRALELLRALAVENRLTNSGAENMDFPTRGPTEGDNRRTCQRAKRQLVTSNVRLA
jgi:tetratricopeptide (TPR) repeat protein